MQKYSPIGIFDSGFGGLTVFKEIERHLPIYDYLYFGDNARVPYGNRSFDTVHEFTWQCLQKMFDLGCDFVILACNTASAKALRTIQQKDLPRLGRDKKVLGVIRPTSEIIADHTDTNHVGVFATKGTVASESYVIEINKFFPEIEVYQVACPMWVPLIENNEHLSDGADYFVKEYVDELLAQSAEIDTIILACTHYPLLIEKIRKYLPKHVSIISQGEIVANSLEDYLENHVEIRTKLSTGSRRIFYTTDDVYDFNRKAEMFLGRSVEAIHCEL